MLCPFKPLTFVQAEYENNMKRDCWVGLIHRHYGARRAQKFNAYSISGMKK
jgi:hypothetical protein